MANDDKEKGCKNSGYLGDRLSGDDAVSELGCKMGDYVPRTLDHIRKHNPDLAVAIKEMDKILVHDGALDRKTKRLIAMACVATRMCEDCVYAQARTAVNYGATKEEIVEAMHVAVVCGGVPTWSTAKRGLTQIFNELDDTDEVFEENTPGGSPCMEGGHRRSRHH